MKKGFVFTMYIMVLLILFSSCQNKTKNHVIQLVREWEQKKKLTLHGDSVLLGDSVIHNYRFCENYYFVSGDKMVNSKDSRYWGLLPEPFIVGRAWLVWKSVSPNTGKMRWKRIFKRID